MGGGCGKVAVKNQNWNSAAQGATLMQALNCAGRPGNGVPGMMMGGGGWQGQQQQQQQRQQQPFYNYGASGSGYPRVQKQHRFPSVCIIGFLSVHSASCVRCFESVRFAERMWLCNHSS